MGAGATRNCERVRAGARVVARSSRGDAARWEAFVERCPDATFFHRIGWREIIDDVFRHRTHYLVAERGGKIVGILPLAEVRSRLFGHALVSLPFCVYGGPAADDADAERTLIDAAADLARSLDVDHLELRNRTAKCPGWPRQDLYVTFRKELLPDAEANLLAIPRKQRAMIRKGIKNGLKSEIDASVDRFFALYADNVHRHGTPPFAKQLSSHACAQSSATRCEILTVTDPRGRPVSGVLSFYFRDEVLPYYAGDTDRRARPRRQRLQVLGAHAPRLRARPAHLRLRPQQARHRLVRLQEELGLRAGAARLRVPAAQARRDSAEQSAQPEVPGADRALASACRVAVANALGPHIVRNLG